MMPHNLIIIYSSIGFFMALIYYLLRIIARYRDNILHVAEKYFDKYIELIDSQKKSHNEIIKNQSELVKSIIETRILDNDKFDPKCFDQLFMSFQKQLTWDSQFYQNLNQQLDMVYFDDPHQIRQNINNQPFEENIPDLSAPNKPNSPEYIDPTESEKLDPSAIKVAPNQNQTPGLNDNVKQDESSVPQETIQNNESLKEIPAEEIETTKMDNTTTN
jgi:hypothetical protein